MPMKLNASKENVSFSMDSYLIDFMDHVCRTSDLNRSQLISRAVKYYCIERILRAHPPLLELIYSKVIDGANEE